MAAPPYLLVLDQGSTSSRAALYTKTGRPAYLARAPLAVTVSSPDRVEHAPADLLASQMAAVQRALTWLGKGGERKIAAIGIANQRSTFLLWDRSTGRPLGRAISWQDRRGSEACVEMARLQPLIRRTTGLRLTPHSTISKLRWLLRRSPAVRRRARAGDLCFGTVNSFLIWHLTRSGHGGAVHATDHTNASRTLMMDLASGRWDQGLLDLFDIPPSILPPILPTAAFYGEAVVNGMAIPILSSIGDQQASLVGQGGYRPGHLALTYGTGGFLLWNIGARPQQRTALLSTPAWSIADRIDYALEGTVNAVGSAILWMQRQLGLIKRPEEIDALCRASREEPVCVPSLSGLGSPHYAPVETVFFGLRRTTTRADLVRGLMAGIAHLMHDNYEQMCRERRSRPRRITAGGGGAQSRWLLQHQADLFRHEIGLSNTCETTSRGAAYLAGLQCGMWKSLDELERWNPPVVRIRPTRPPRDVQCSIARWRRAVALAGKWTAGYIDGGPECSRVPD
ncbi:MAG TPA: FGGY family carbohydrate kinase [Nitrospiria bacterium]|nr:FGGY family carbohydrate kinase [Nitrospiria bacterium]